MEPRRTEDTHVGPSGSCDKDLLAESLIEEPTSMENLQAEAWEMLQIESPTVKFFSKVPGGFQKHIQGSPLYMKNFHFTEVPSPESCDVILNFCPHSEAGPCIEALHKETPAGKSAILALMHHTEDPAYVVPDSSSFRKEPKDIHIVDFLYSERTGLLKCAKNDEAHGKFMEIIKSLESLEWDLLHDAKEAECQLVRVHKVISRSVKKHISTFQIGLDENPNMIEVTSSEWSDVTLAFFPIVSRVGTDIEAALKDIEVSKPGILVAMHHTFDQDYVIPDTSRFGRNRDVLIVDCLFHEDRGLLDCKANQEALEQIKRCLAEEHKKKCVDSSSQLTVAIVDYAYAFDYAYNFTRYSLAQIDHLINFCWKLVLGESSTHCPSEKQDKE